MDENINTALVVVVILEESKCKLSEKLLLSRRYVRSHGCAVGAGLSTEETVVQTYIPPFQKLGNFVHLTLPMSFGRDTKSRWPFLSGAYDR